MWLDVTTSFAWHRVWPVPEALPVRQVHAWIVDEAGRALLLELPVGWRLPGCALARRDADWLAALRRRLRREADVTVRDVLPLGYQLVHPSDAEPHAQLRVVARMDVWHERTASPGPGPGPELELEPGAELEPERGPAHPRVWVPLDQAAALLNWGEPGRAQAVAVAQTACERYGFDAAGLLAQGADHPGGPVTQMV